MNKKIKKINIKLIYSQFGSRLREARKEKNMTQGDLAKKLNCGIPFVSQIENGKKKIGLEMMYLAELELGTLWGNWSCK